MAERRRRILRNHFKEVLQGLQTAVRAGYSMEQGVTECRREMERLFGNGDDLVRELRYMESQMQVGVPGGAAVLESGSALRCGGNP